MLTRWTSILDGMEFTVRGLTSAPSRLRRKAPGAQAGPWEAGPAVPPTASRRRDDEAALAGDGAVTVQ